MSASFGEIIKQKLLNKKVEIYQGDAHQSMNGYADFDVQDKTVLYGTLVDVQGECLMLKVSRDGKTGMVYIHTWSIVSITADEGVNIADAYRPASRVTHAKKIHDGAK